MTTEIETPATPATETPATPKPRNRNRGKKPATETAPATRIYTALTPGDKFYAADAKLQKQFFTNYPEIETFISDYRGSREIGIALFHDFKNPETGKTIRAGGFIKFNGKNTTKKFPDFPGDHYTIETANKKFPALRETLKLQKLVLFITIYAGAKNPPRLHISYTN